MGRPSQSKSHCRQKGFTLIELMIVVAIVGIITAIALPSYFQYINRSHRADVKTALLADAQFLERFKTESQSNAYNADSNGNAVTAAGLTALLPFQNSPLSGTTQYGISIDAGTFGANSYTLLAIPAAGGSMVGDECNTFTLDNLGVKGLIGATQTVAICWNK